MILTDNSTLTEEQELAYYEENYAVLWLEWAREGGK